MIEIVTIGDELLLGHTIDTNAAYISEHLAAVGLRVTRRATVGDDVAAIRAAVAEALARTKVVITTGGLGPTSDDFTKPVLADLYDRRLVLDDVYLEKLRMRWRQRGMEMPAANITQAQIPAGAEIVRNPVGSAQGIALEDPALGLTIMLPGVPHEVRAMTDDHLIPFLLARVPVRAEPICHLVLRTTGIPESLLADRIDEIAKSIAPISVAFLPSYAGTDIRLTSWAAYDQESCDAVFRDAEQRLRARLGSHIYATGRTDLAVVVGEKLRARGLKLTLAESCTGGLLGKRITDISGASDYFETGFVTYANHAKEKLLGVSPETIARHGAVSEEVAREMAIGALQAANSDVAVSITGIAGPTGGSDAKPVGLVWTALAAGDTVRTRSFIMPGDREEVRERAAQMALALLYDFLDA
ncbi:MAG TPA: competence/damage-inducible protein A [Longimicrobiales bacterium]